MIKIYQGKIVYTAIRDSALSVTKPLMHKERVQARLGSAEREKRMERYLLDKNWEYTESGLQNPLMVDLLKGWKKTDLPHDYAMEKVRSKTAPSGLDEGFTQGAGLYYRKSFVLKEAAADKKVWIEFEGVSGVTEVWVNQKFAAKHSNPYTSFWVDITSCVRVGENTVSLHTDSSAKPCSRWYVGAGIYRPVWLYISEKTAVLPHGVRITTQELKAGEAKLSVEMDIHVSEEQNPGKIPIRLEVFTKEGECIYQSETTRRAESSRMLEKENICLKNITAWTPDSPCLYTMRITVADGDAYEEQFGIRTIKVSAEQGF